jgi:hypothetical protein
MQTRWQSFFESCINVAIGYGVALMSQILIFPLFGIHIPLASNLAIGAIFTVISIARSYAVRRVFNRLALLPAFGIQYTQCDKRGNQWKHGRKSTTGFMR